MNIACLFFTAVVTAQANEFGAWLQKADGYRLTSGSVRVETQIRLYDHNKLKRKRDYYVYIKPGRRSLVVFRSSSEYGQKVLMRDDQFHLFLPKSRRAIRITPMQKLLGEASTGDIATMTWHEDYTATLLSSTERVFDVPSNLLELTSARKGSSYHRIELYLQKESMFPLFARLYLKSGKLAKEATFVRGKRNGRDTVVGMTLTDRIQTGQKTQIVYRSMQSMQIPDKYYHPQFLLRHALD